MDVYWIISFFVLGILFGSFFNVVGLRFPKKLPFHNDRSFCPSCKSQLNWYELIPILSYIMQRGKCRDCRTTISFMYPFIEAATGCLFMFSYIKIGLELELLTALLLVSMLMILFVTDVMYMLIPNKILLFFLPLFVIMRMISPLDPWYDAIFGAVSGFSFIALIILFSKGGMGGGDMKLFGVLGIVLGWQNTLLTFFIAVFLGAIIGGVFMLIKKVKKRQAIPFGPYIVVGALISYFYGEQIVTIYVSLW